LIKTNECPNYSSDFEIFADMTDPESSDGTIIAQFVSLSQVVRVQAEAIKALQGLPKIVENLQNKLLPQSQDNQEINMANSSDELFDGILDNTSEVVRGKSIKKIRFLFKMTCIGSEFKCSNLLLLRNRRERRIDEITN